MIFLSSAPAACLAASSFGFLHLAAPLYTWFFVKTAILQLPLEAVKLHLFLENPESLFQIVLDIDYNRQGNPPFLFKNLETISGYPYGINRKFRTDIVFT